MPLMNSTKTDEVRLLTVKEALFWCWSR